MSTLQKQWEGKSVSTAWAAEAGRCHTHFLVGGSEYETDLHVCICCIYSCVEWQCLYSCWMAMFVHHLSQHYHTVHGLKEYICQKCGKKFGLRDVCSRTRHERRWSLVERHSEPQTHTTNMLLGRNTPFWFKAKAKKCYSVKSSDSHCEECHSAAQTCSPDRCA